MAHANTPMPKGSIKGGTSNVGLGGGKKVSIDQANHQNVESYPKNGKTQSGGAGD